MLRATKFPLLARLARSRGNAFAVAAVALWSLVLLSILIRVAISPARNTVVSTYQAAGQHWIDAQPLYKNSRGFVYSPLIAAFFAPLSFLPTFLMNMLWRFGNVAIYVGAVWQWLKSGLDEGIKDRKGLIFLLLLPLSVGNFNNGQVNPALIGLLMFATIGVRHQRWFQAAFCIAIVTYLKIYPLAAGLLLVLLFPRPFAPRLIFALVALGCLTFLLQRPSYVWDQYHRWFWTRFADDRRLWKQAIAPRDLWLLLRCLHIRLSETGYIVLQVVSGAAIGALCVFGRSQRWRADRVLVASFTLVCCWMLLLGPATESATYILLAPPLVFALVQTFQLSMGHGMRMMVASAYLLLLFGECINSFTPLRSAMYWNALQPFGALLFVIYAGILFMTPRFWKATPFTPSTLTPEGAT